MRFSLSVILATTVAVAISVPLPRLGKTARQLRQGLFKTAMTMNGIGDVRGVAAQLANALSSDPSICAPVFQVFDAIIAGEADTTGANTLGDRAVAGARKLLRKQNEGEAGLFGIVDGLTNVGGMPRETLAALQTAMATPEKTIASLRTYKYLVDTQSALAELGEAVDLVGGDRPIKVSVEEIQPVLRQVENTIDKIGADFSVQNVIKQAEDVQNILSLVNLGDGNIRNLTGLNKSFAAVITELTDKAQAAMESLAKNAAEAASIDGTVMAVDPAIFINSPGPGTACSATGAARSRR